MSRSSRFPCRHSHCNALLGKPGFCAAHADDAKVSSRANDLRRGSSTQRGYDYRWQKTRKGYLDHHPLCVLCEAAGRVTAANEVDHIIPLQVDPMRKYDRTNWQALCKPCHVAKTNKDRVKYDLGRGGHISTPLAT